MYKKFLIILLCLTLTFSGCARHEGEENKGNEFILEEQAPNEKSTEEDAVIPSEQIVSNEEEPEATQEASGTVTPALPEASFFQIHYIDVGQADAALILCDDRAMLIDGGNSEDSSIIYSFLKQRGISKLDYIVCTHAHEDHVGGLSGALNYASVDNALCPVTEYDSKAFSSFVKYLGQQDIDIRVPEHGEVFTLGSATCQIIGPIYTSDEPNNTSIVLRLQYGNTSFLFTGDAESEEEHDIINAGYDISCDVLKVGHHGSDTSTSYLWLRNAAPKYAVLSVGAGNSYGHPTENTLSKLRDAEVIVFRTDLQGTVTCTSNGETIAFSVERNPNVNTLAGAGAGGNHSSEKDEQQSASESEITYVLNTNSKKIHYPNCSSVDQMAEHNKKEVTSTREEVIAQGYSPCGRCKP